MKTGTLRQDIELIRPGAHGNYPMLFDPLSESYFRIDANTALMISKMDQNYELDRFIERLSNAGLTVTEAEVIELVNFLRQNNLLAPEYGEYEAKKRQMDQVRKDTLLLRIASAYMFFKLPPWHPDRFFRMIRPYVRFLADRRVIFTALIPAVLGYLLILRDFSTVRSTFLDSISWAGLAKFFAAIVVMKIIHEASHSLAAMRFNCRVRAIGVSFIVFYPRIFTDTTDSWRLPLRQRMMIDCAGILGEVIVGGIAALLWCYLPPGVMKSTMFYIFAVGTLSTLLVNGNPLIRYDGYYILCDILNVDNLMGSSAACLKQYWRYWFFGLGSKPQEPRRVLLVTFGIASFLYRIVLYTSIILIIYHSFVKAVAVVLLLLEIYTLLIYPLYREIRTIRQMSKRAAVRANWYWSVLSLLILLVVLFFPLSWNVILPGEIVPEKSELVTVEEGGFLASEWPRLPVRVKKGDELFALSQPGLHFGIEKFKWSCRLDELLFRLQQLDRETYSASQVTEEKLRSDVYQYLMWAANAQCDTRDTLALGRAQNKLMTELMPILARDFWKQGFTLHIAPKIGVRECRRVIGDKVITSEDLFLPKYPDDVISQGRYVLDSWGRENLKGIEKKILKFGIPYFATIVKGIDNLMMAGKHISGTSLAMSAYRVQPIVASMGQAVGWAAAEAAKKNTSPRNLEVKEIQKAMAKQEILPKEYA